MNRKTRLLIPFFVFVILITLGMGGLYTDFYNTFGDLFGSSERVDELIVQKASAYSASSLAGAVENVSSVNILELTLENDISYEGEALVAGPLSVSGSNTFYIDVNGHSLDIKSEESGGFFMEESTFYAVDTVGGGDIEINSKQTGILCKNFVFESGTMIVDIADDEGEWVGPYTPAEHYYSSETSESILEGSDIDVDELGYWNVDYNNTINNSGKYLTDGVRAYVSAVIGSNSDYADTPCYLYLYGGYGCEDKSSFRIQTTACGLRVGDSSPHVNDGKIIVKNYGGEFVSTGSMGMFANKIELLGGTCRVFGACGGISDYFDQTAICFSDSHGFDGYFQIGANATVYASTPVNTGAIFSFCCDYVKIEGTLYSGCSGMGYYQSDGNISMTPETTYFWQTHRDDGSGWQKLAIGVDIGDIIIDGPNAKVCLLGSGRTIMAGRDASGAWGFGNGDGGCGFYDMGWSTWSGGVPNYATWINEWGSVIAYSLYDYAYISAELYAGKIKAKNPEFVDGLENISQLTYQLTHAGSLTIKNGATVMVKSDENGKGMHSSAIYCSGTDRSGENAAINIVGTKTDFTRVYLDSSQFGIYTDNCSVNVGENALLSMSIRHEPTDSSWNPDNGKTTYACYGYRGISQAQFMARSAWGLYGYCIGNNGGGFFMDKGAVVECHVAAGNGYSVGIDASGGMSYAEKNYERIGVRVRNGSTLYVEVDSVVNSDGTYNHNKSLGINSWSKILIQSGSNVQCIAGGTALRSSDGDLWITGENTKCTFVTKGGQFNIDSELWELNSHYGAVSMRWGQVYICGSATVYCSSTDEDDRTSGLAGIHGLGNINIYDRAKVVCTNFEKGIRGQHAVNIYDNATVEIYNVLKGINADYTSGASTVDPGIYIWGNATINVDAERDAITAHSLIRIGGTPKISVKSSYSGTASYGAGIWTYIGKDNVDGINIDMGYEGYISVSVVNGLYGIGTADGNVTIKGSGTIVSEAERAAVRSFDNVYIENSANSNFSFYGNDGYGIYGDVSVNISGSGYIYAGGKEHAVFSGTKDTNADVTSATYGNVNISGTVNLVADGTYGGTSSVSSVSTVTQNIDGTTQASSSNSKYYKTLTDLAIDKGGFYAIITNAETKSAFIAVGEEYWNNGNYSSRYSVMSTSNISGGPEEIWYFDYQESGEYAGSYTIQNYLTGQYMCVEGTPTEGARVVTTTKLWEGNCHFGIVASRLETSELAAPYANRYIIYSCWNGFSFVNSGVYGEDYGKYCLNLNENLGTAVDGDYGTQVNDRIYVHLGANDEAPYRDSETGEMVQPKVTNMNQVFSIDAIADLGDEFYSYIKSVKLNQYLDFHGAASFGFNETGDNFFFDRDDTGLYPFSYEISKNGYCLDLSNGVLTKNNPISVWYENNLTPQKFRIVYSIGSNAYSFMPLKTPWMVYIPENDTRMISQISHYNANRRFILENYGNEAVSNISDGKSGNEGVWYTSMFGNTVTLRIDLSTYDVNRFVMTMSSYNISAVDPEKWTLYQCDPSDPSKIGKKVSITETSIGNRIPSQTLSNASLPLNKIMVDLDPDSSSITTYYLVLEAQAGAECIRLSEVAFYAPTSGNDNSSGISASNSVNISVTGSGSVYALGRGYGIRCAKNVVIAGAVSTDGTGISKVEAYGIGTDSRGLHVQGSLTTSYCTLIAEGSTLGIGAGSTASVVTIGNHSTVDAIGGGGTGGYGIKSLGSVKISPSASVYAEGAEVSGNGSITPAPVSTEFGGAAVYEVQFHYATVETKNSILRKYENEFFVANISHCGDVAYSTIASNYTPIKNSYFGVGHNNRSEHYSLYFYLPEGSYINTVDAYNKGETTSKFSVNYAVAGYNKIDENGELMFTAKYDMGSYTKLSNEYITSANVESARIDVYPLNSFSLETYKIYVNQVGTELSTIQRAVLLSNVGNSDGDTEYTWSEVKYYIEKMTLPGNTVYVKVIRNGLAFSTITVPSEVTVEIYSDDVYSVARAVFDTELTAPGLDSIYEPTPSGGKYPLEGEENDVMLNGYDKIKLFYMPSDEAYTASLGYPSLSQSHNGLSLPLFHLDGDSQLNISENINFDNVKVSTGITY